MPIPTLAPLQAQHKARVSHLKSSKRRSLPPTESIAQAVGFASNPNPESVSPERNPDTQAASRPATEHKTIKPSGYVQEASGVIEAIIADGDGVQVVHVGDAYKGSFTVAQISPNAVEVVANAMTPPHSLYRQTGMAASTLNEAKTAGYVEKPDGTRMDVVAADGTVSLVQTGKNQAVSASNQEPADSVQTAQTLDRPAPKPKQVATNLNSVNAIAGPSNHSPAPGKTFEQKHVTEELNKDGSQSALALISSPNGGATAQPAIPFRPIGFVEKANGKVQAIVDDGDGVQLALVPKDQVEILTASVRSLGTRLTDGGPSAPFLKRTDRIASLHPGNKPASGLSTEGTRSIGFGPSEPVKVLQSRTTSLPAAPQSSGQKDKPPLQPEVTIADDKVIPEKPPTDEAAITASFGEETGAGESAKRDDAVLESLGIVNSQDGRASPEIASFEPAAPSTGPPESDVGVPSSFGFEDWHYGRASPLQSDLGPSVEASDSSGRQPTVLKSIGYIEWQDGRAFAVINDGKGGVRLAAKGEILDGRYRVVKVGPDEMDLEEMPARRISMATPALRFGPEDQPLSDFVEARPVAATIVRLPFAPINPALVLAMAVMAQPPHSTKGRSGNKPVEPQAPRTPLRIAPGSRVSQIQAPLDGTLGPQRGAPQQAQFNLGPTKDASSFTPWAAFQIPQSQNGP
ncbi:MAG TPA: hypothetical protein VG028_16835 [Terriglobia bacterium]|nr:hypothetical protein [Terriglobia bacterium]